ncbi:uncharacterized protein LOC143187131 [Calliopsis andreniformis]|uniref:uncharacterized protein LOC143187131 n=1 Tax=Calliopsis andreniformis TaxID=337506 RepID=UPI003FCD1F2C
MNKSILSRNISQFYRKYFSKYQQEHPVYPPQPKDKPFLQKFNSSFYELQQRVRKTAAIDNNVDNSLSEEAFIHAHELPLTIPKSNLEDSQEIGNTPGPRRGGTIARGIEEETQMDDSLNERSIASITVKMNTESAEEVAKRGTSEETNRAERSIHPETRLKAAVAFEETLAILLDQLDGKSTNESELRGNCYQPKNEREECAESVCYCKNEADRLTNDNEDDARYKSGTQLQIEEEWPTNAGECLVESKMEIQETGARRSFVDFPVSVLQESNNLGMKSSRLLGEEIIDSEVCPWDNAASMENELMERSCGTLSGEDDGSKMALDGIEERLKVDTEICSKQDDYLGEQFGIFPERGANCTEEKSIMHSEDTSSQGEEKEKVGNLPIVEMLRGTRDAESSTSLVRPESKTSDTAAMNQGKEEEDLNVMIRRLIITELKKHRNKERAILKRAYSDTESSLPRKKSSARDRAGLVNLKGRTFFRDLLELEESLRKKSEEKSDSESMDDRPDENTVRIEESMNQDEDHSKKDNNVDETVTESNGNIESVVDSLSISCVAHSNILLERKVDQPCLMDVEEQKLTDGEKSLFVHKQEYANKSSQTEHIHVIRTVRSCPLRRRRLSLQMQLQLHRLPLDREAVCSKIVYASRDFTEYIFRKASDNLIYEKGKGSRSPSYVSSPERFRWRYLTPKKIS